MSHNCPDYVIESQTVIASGLWERQFHCTVLWMYQGPILHFEKSVISLSSSRIVAPTFVRRPGHYLEILQFSGGKVGVVSVT